PARVNHPSLLVLEFSCSRLRRACSGLFGFRPSFPVTDQIGEETKPSWNSCAQLPIPNHTRIDVVSFSVWSYEQAASQWCFSFIAGCQQRRVVRVPFLRKVKSTLLDPVLKVSLCDSVW